MVVASMALVPNTEFSEENFVSRSSTITAADASSSYLLRQPTAAIVDHDSAGSDEICNVDKKARKVNDNVLTIFGKGKQEQRLKKLVSLQLDLIEHQQSNIVDKDRQIISLKSEKEQLEARLSRMERRLALQKRHSLEIDDYAPKSKFASTSKIESVVPHPNKQATPTDAEKITLLPVNVTSRGDRNFKFNNYLRTDQSFLHMTTKLTLNLEQYDKDGDSEQSDVSVPPWRLLPDNVCPVIVNEIKEDVSNEAFFKRHLKPETEEKRRKRWDLQHLRQQRHHEMLTQKYNSKQAGKVNMQSYSLYISTLNTLYRDPSNVMAIEVSDIVPVCAFGYPLPAVDTKEMELPWFSIAKREIQLRTSKEKVTKRLKSSHKKAPYKLLISFEDSNELLLRSRIDQQSELICILKRRADEYLEKCMKQEEELKLKTEECTKYLKLYEKEKQSCVSKVLTLEMVGNKNDDLLQENGILNRDNEKMKNEYELLKAENEKLIASENAARKHLLQELRKTIQERDSEVTGLKDQLKTNEKIGEKKCKELKCDLDAAHNRLKDDTASLTKQVGTLKNIISETKSKLQTSHQKVKATQQQVAQLQKEVQNTKDQLMIVNKLYANEQEKTKDLEEQYILSENGSKSEKRKLLQHRITELEEELKERMLHFEAHKKHAEELLLKERSINEKLRRVKSQKSALV